MDANAPTLFEDPAALRILAESLRAHGAGCIRLRGDSMLPTLRDGWEIEVRAVPSEALRVGDVAIFIHRNVLTIHRLIWKKEEAGSIRFIFQGDNSTVREAVTAGEILGRVETARENPSGPRDTPPNSVGLDARAFFYRNAYRITTILSRWVPGLGVPGEGKEGGFLYRGARALFRVIERAFSPRRTP